MSRAESRTADDLLTAADVARLWGTHLNRVYARREALAAKGRVYGRRLGRQWVFTRREAEAMRPGKPGRPRAATGDQ